MYNFILTPLTASGQNQTAATIQLVATFGIMIALFYFLMIRPQRKKEKKEVEMRKNVQVGDEIVTVGGVVGLVFSVKEDTVVIETGGDRSKIRIKKWAIAQNLTKHENDK